MKVFFISTNIMSNKKAKNPPKARQQQVYPLANLTQLSKLIILLPKSVSKEQINLTLMSYYLKEKLKNKKVQVGQNFIALYMGQENSFKVVETVCQEDSHKTQKQEGQEEGVFVATEKTQIVLRPAQEQIVKPLSISPPNKMFGYTHQFSQLKQTILSSLTDRLHLLSSGLDPLKALLLSGYSGSGKSLMLSQLKYQLANQTLQEGQISVRQYSAVQLLSRVVGGSEEMILDIFEQLRKDKPAVLILEDIHLLFGKKEAQQNQTMLAALLNQIEKTVEEPVIVVASFNCERELASSLSGCGKFEKQIKLGLPNHSIRFEILSGLIQSMKLQKAEEFTSDNLKSVNLRLNGFSAGQIKQILRQAYLKHQSALSFCHLEQILKSYRPTDIKELIVEVPEVYWHQVGGYQDVKQEIKKVIELPLKYPHKFTQFGIEPSKGILLYGPPGCSKTMMAKAIATESKLNFIAIKGPELFSKFVGDSERAIRSIFRKARTCSPCVIFFDEIDALAGQRAQNTEVSDRVLCQLLNEMDGIEGLKEVMIIAATNRPEVLDPALVRPGRFDYLIYVAPPSLEARKQIFKINLIKAFPSEKIQQLSTQLAEKTEDYTGAEITLLCRQAVLISLEKDINCDTIDEANFQEAFKKVKKRLTKFQIQKYQQFRSTIKYE